MKLATVVVKSRNGKLMWLGEILWDYFPEKKRLESCKKRENIAEYTIYLYVYIPRMNENVYIKKEKSRV